MQAALKHLAKGEIETATPVEYILDTACSSLDNDNFYIH